MSNNYFEIAFDFILQLVILILQTISDYITIILDYIVTIEWQDIKVIIWACFGIVGSIKLLQAIYKLSQKKKPPFHMNLTEKQLAEYDGTHASGRILIAINDNIYDVTKQKHIYGPEGWSHCYAGKDVAKHPNMLSGAVNFEGDEEFHKLLIKGATAKFETNFKRHHAFVGKIICETTESPSKVDENEKEELEK